MVGGHGHWRNAGRCRMGMVGDALMPRMWTNDRGYIKAKTKRDAVLVFVLVFVITIAVLIWR